MHYRAIATDYDGTLATDGIVAPQTWTAIAAFRKQGGQLLLVTGRELTSLQQVCPTLDVFDAVVAENGAIVYWPQSGQVSLLGNPPPPEFLDRLQQAGVRNIHCGRVIVATWQPHGEVVTNTIAAMQLDYEVILNKRAVMVLPTGVDKALGLQKAIAELQIPPQQVVGIGDAENDIPLLEVSGLGVAVGNALPELKTIADAVMVGERGAGVEELIHQLLDDSFI